METTTLTPKYRWNNRLSDRDRLDLLLKYQEGYCVNQIAAWLSVSGPTVEYHLKTHGVYVPYRKATMFVQTNPLPQRVVPIVHRTLTVVPRKIPQDDARYYYDEYGEKYQRPKSYAQLLRRARNLELKKMYQAQAQHIEDTQKQPNFLIRVSLESGNAIMRQQDGSYQITRTDNDSSRFSVSSSLISY